MSDTQNPGGWPDASKPGVPANPERDSEGHVWRMDGEVDVYRWVAGNQLYEDCKGRWVIPADLLADGDTYLGRIVHPAEVEAEKAAARREGVEEAAKWHDAKAAWWSQGAESAHLEPDLSADEIAARVDEFRANAAEHVNSAAAIRALLTEGGR